MTEYKIDSQVMTYFNQYSDDISSFSAITSSDEPTQYQETMLNHDTTNNLMTENKIEKEIMSYITIQITEFISLEKIVDNILNDFNQTEIDKGKSKEWVEENMHYSITSSETQKSDKFQNKTCIDLGECEDKLKNAYNIPKQNSLYIIKIEYHEEGMNIPKIEYIPFYPFINLGLTKLNMTICQDTKIEISIPVTINDDLDKHNIGSKYYNNICSKATSGKGTDINLNDRKNEFIDKNMTLCEEDCDLIYYNYTNKKAHCSCLVKIKLPFLDEIKFNKTKLIERFTNIQNLMNFGILKCLKIVLTKNGLKSNIGFYFFIVIFVIKFVSIFTFCLKDYSSLVKKIFEIEKDKNQKFKYENKNIKKTGLSRIDKNNDNLDKNKQNIFNQRKNGSKIKRKVIKKVEFSSNKKKK